jgi:uncharacterized membrane protein YgdD (TMEM256/DUF423 family)
MSKKKITVLLIGGLIAEFLVAWLCFIYLPPLGLVVVLLGWMTMAYGIYLLVRQPKGI